MDATYLLHHLTTCEYYTTPDHTATRDACHHPAPDYSRPTAPHSSTCTASPTPPATCQLCLTTTHHFDYHGPLYPERPTTYQSEQGDVGLVDNAEG